MKKLLLASLAVLAMGAQAAPIAGTASPGTINHGFDASVSFTPACRKDAANDAANTLSFGTYTGFQQTAATATAITSKIECSNNMVQPTVAIDAIGGSSTQGIIAGLQYTFDALTVTPALGANSSQSSNIPAVMDTYSTSIGGSIAADQPGERLAQATQARILVWSF